MKQIFFTLILVLTFLGSQAQSEVIYEMVVAKDGSGDFTSIQVAVDATKAFPDKRITIYIKNGIYREKVRIPSWNKQLSLIGEDAEKTIITFDDYFDKINRGRNSTFFTYTLLVESDDFFAENLTIENTAGQVGQAVALHVEGNRCAFKNCRILGNQDTLYLSGENSHQYFSKCTIEGTTDFIFGSATVVFRGCRIVSKSNSFITAASTTEGKEFGFVFMNCELLSSDGADEVYLGRPWRPFAKTVFMECYLGKHIRPEGWKEWSNAENPRTTFYGEYKNTGPGSDVSKRVEWSHQLSNEAVLVYSLPGILGKWILSVL